MFGYKIFGANYTCREYKYSKTNKLKGKLVMHKNAFHFSLCPVDCLLYYNLSPANTYAYVESGKEYEIKNNTVATTELKIVKTLTYEEFMKLASGDIKTEYIECSYVEGQLDCEYKTYDIFTKQLNAHRVYEHGVLVKVNL